MQEGTSLSTVDDEGQPPEGQQGQQRRDHGRLFTERSLMIMVPAIAVGMMAGFVAGITAAVKVASAGIGPAGSAGVGILAGVVAAVLTTLVVVKGLDALVGK
jgi:hypothetical protein